MPTHSNFEIKKQEKYFVHSCTITSSTDPGFLETLADPNEFLNKVDVRCAWIAISSAVPF